MCTSDNEVRGVGEIREQILYNLLKQGCGNFCYTSEKWYPLNTGSYKYGQNREVYPSVGFLTSYLSRNVMFTTFHNQIFFLLVRKDEKRKSVAISIFKYLEGDSDDG